MRKKLYIGLFVMAIVGIVAGERLFNRLRGAQEASKQAEAAQRKDAAPVFPPLPTGKDDKLVIPAPAPGALEPSPVAQYGGPQDPPKPAVLEFPPMKSPLPGAALPPADFVPRPADRLTGAGVKPAAVEDKKADLPRFEIPGIPGAATVQADPKKDDKDPPTVVLPPIKPAAPPFVFPNPTVEPGTKRTGLTQEEIAVKMKHVQQLMKENKLKEAQTILDQMRELDPDNIQAVNTRRIIETRLNQDSETKPVVKYAPQGGATTPLPTVPLPPVTTTAVTQHLEKLKHSPWSLHIEITDGQTVATATVNKKYAFKVVCQSLEVSTGKDMLKASGKVTITSDMLTGHCETLGIALLDDRLILEGGADVRIQKASNNVSDTKPVSFELKGETLNLRISDLQAAKLNNGDWRQVSNSSAIPVRPATTPSQGAKWSQMGVLRRVEDKTQKAGETVWRLEDPRGLTILLLVARDGGTLAQYEGRRISVFGAAEQIAGESMLRVSHIALP